MIYDDIERDFIDKVERKKNEIIINSHKGTPHPKPLFDLTDNQEDLYFKIIHSIAKVSEEECLNLIGELLSKYGIKYEREHIIKGPNDRLFVFDIIATIDGQQRFFEVRDSQYADYDMIKSYSYYANYAKIPGDIVLLIKNDLNGSSFIEKFRIYMDQHKIYNLNIYLFEDFIDEIFGNEELNSFQKFMNNLSDEVRKSIGYQLTEICSRYNIDKLKEILLKEIPEFNYDAIKISTENKFFDYEEEKQDDNNYMNVTDINEALNNGYEAIKNVYFDDERYKVLLGDRDFSESFITSEWIFRKYSLGEELDNTFVVTGYLKSVEQLLWDIILIIGRGRRIKRGNRNVVNEDIHTTLGDLEYFITEQNNRDLFSEIFSGRDNIMMDYFEFQIHNWRDKERNGYFHKDQLHDPEKIKLIRNETYFLYFLILGSVNLDENELTHLTEQV